MAQIRTKKVAEKKKQAASKSCKKTTKAQADARRAPTRAELRQMAKEWDHVT